MKLLVYLLAFTLSLATGLAVAYAFEPQNVRLWPNTTTSPMNEQLAATSTMTWEAVDEYGYSGWESDVARSLDTDSVDPDSLGRVLNGFLTSENRGRITFRKARADELPDMRHYGVSTAFLAAKCGGDAQWYTACVYLLNARPVPAYYKLAVMLTWPYTSRAVVIRHETFHAVGRACDQYRGGCPRASDGVWESTVVCTGNGDTLMDCGGAAHTATRFDYDTFVSAYPASTSFLRQVVVPEWGPCDTNGVHTWCYNNWDADKGLPGWHWKAQLTTGVTQEWRHWGDGGAWFCVDHCGP